MYVGLLFVAVLAASTHAYSIHSGNVDEKLRLLNPSFMMIEQLFNLQDEKNCIEKLFCLIETEMAEETKNPLKHYSRFLTNFYQEIEPLAFEKVKALLAKYSHISKVVDAIALGQSTDSKTCTTKYQECPNEKDELMSFVKMLGDNELRNYMPNLLKKRGNPGCDATNNMCTVSSGACALCTIFTEGLCGLLCAPVFIWMENS